MTKGPSGLGGKGGPRGVLRINVGVLPCGPSPKVSDLRRILLDWALLRLQLPPLWAFHNPGGLFKGKEGAGNALVEGRHQCASLSGRLHGHEARFPDLRPVGP